MYTIYKLTLAAIKMFLRSKQALFFSLFMPFIIMFIFGFIGFDTPPTIDVGLVTHNPRANTPQFIEQIKAFPTFKIHEGVLEEELVQLNEGNRAIVLDIPDYLIPATPQPKEEQQEIIAHENVGQIGQAQTVVSILNHLSEDLTITQAGVVPIFAVQERQVNAHNLRYIEFLLPGLIALSIMQMSVFSVAFVFTQYKEKGILKRLLATPMRPYKFVVANVFTRLLMSVVQAILFIAIGIILFKAHVVGSYWLLLLSVVLGAIMFLGLGFSISGVSKTVDSVPAIANIVVFPMLFLGGTFFPLSNMPGWLQAFAQFLPLTYFSTALREVMTKGSGFLDIWPDLLGMVVWGVILIAVATITFSFQEKESA